MRPERALLEWYRPRRRRYPWRRSRDPYSVLVSEVMLQQTQASRVVEAFGRFLGAFPTVRALAAAPRADVVRAWDGLGYNRRAVALSEAARVIVREHGGEVPSDPEVLRTLPGVGPYTAAAVASIAFGKAAAAVDTNVARVVARVHLGPEAADVSSGRVRALAAGWLDREDPGGWNQALMDLGREICRPRPGCDVCPIARRCRSRDAVPTAPRRRRDPAPFAGSPRQVRGSVVGSLRTRRWMTVGTLARQTGFDAPAVVSAVLALHADGLVDAGPGARRGMREGRVRLRP